LHVTVWLQKPRDIYTCGVLNTYDHHTFQSNGDNMNHYSKKLLMYFS